MGVRVSSEGRMMVTVGSESRVWSTSGRRMVMGGEVLALMRNVYVVVVPLRRTKGAIKHLKSPDELDLEELLKDINQRHRDSRQQKQVDLRRAYITARFTPGTLPAFFTLGDQLDYGGFENRALEPGQDVERVVV
ncbi:hypothetical protein CRUP_011159 [Coryphaenoides rupestris]|nr:hypothetical protein CRUP_011159 [Coryphaenoides rupestris]